LNKSDYPLLVVEDSPDDAAFIRRAFEKANLKNPIVVVPNAEGAEAFLLGKSPYEGRILPAVILLDLGLPGRPGIEILQWLRKQKDFSFIPVVVLSGSEDPAVVNRSYEAGANSYVSKNALGTDVLAERVRGLLTYWLESNFPRHVKP
jgi:CheY-like chemotaxis protein